MNYGPYVPHEFGAQASAHYRLHTGWLTAACWTSVPWPKDDDVHIVYNGDSYWLRGIRDHPQGGRNGPAITMLCPIPEAADVVLAKLYKFASILGWFKQGYVDVGGYMRGSGPILYSEAQSVQTTLEGSRHGFDCNYLPVAIDDQTWRALAFWREGSRLRHIHTGYAFLSFFKVLESQLSSSERKAWFPQAISKLKGAAANRVQQIIAEFGDDVGEHIYESGRCAIVHAQYSDGRGNPDLPQDRRRLTADLVVVEALARMYIADVLEVPTWMDVYRSRDRLECVETIVPAHLLVELRAGRFVSRRSLRLHGITIGIAEWPSRPDPVLAALTLRVQGVRDGVLHLEAVNASLSIAIAMVLIFTQGRAHIDLEASRYHKPRTVDELEAAIAVIRMRKAALGNGKMEMWLPDGGRIDFEEILPVNVDIGATWRAWDKEIAQLEQLRPAVMASGQL